MSKFVSGYTYLARVDKGWYIVQQISMKGWVATLFSHTCHASLEADRHFKGNGVSLFKEMEETDGGILEYHAFTVNSSMRETMFNILKYGRVTSKE